MDATLSHRISEHLREAGYTAADIAAGIAYAEVEGYGAADEALSLVVSRILYTDGQLEDGERFGVEPGSW